MVEARSTGTQPLLDEIELGVGQQQIVIGPVVWKRVDRVADEAHAAVAVAYAAVAQTYVDAAGSVHSPKPPEPRTAAIKPEGPPEPEPAPGEPPPAPEQKEPEKAANAEPPDGGETKTEVTETTTGAIETKIKAAETKIKARIQRDSSSGIFAIAVIAIFLSIAGTTLQGMKQFFDPTKTLVQNTRTLLQLRRLHQEVILGLECNTPGEKGVIAYSKMPEASERMAKLAVEIIPDYGAYANMDAVGPAPQPPPSPPTAPTPVRESR